MTAKQQHSFLDGGINRCVALHFLYALPNLNIVPHQATKKGNSDGSMGSKSKTNLMKSYEKIKKEAELKLKKQKRENALDIISKSLKKL
ncbi:hypothetical protein [Candidatus Ulvibacter alkanivorans]|uniref:hypothetical protein n=1 Tax=Candidatus Ulvibacter alkanivorans TaxID=2267620 RepID=UPI00109CB695|nr:hypothetical protein [Candidatus Ulvibacter alkanivorans]